MYLAYYYPFSTPEMVKENTGFDIDVSRAVLMEGPSEEIIKTIREEIDPGQAFIKVPKEAPSKPVEKEVIEEVASEKSLA